VALPRIECANFGKSIGEFTHQWLGKILFATQKASQILLEDGYLLHRYATHPWGALSPRRTPFGVLFSVHILIDNSLIICYNKINKYFPN
jgi:hypothetical protein